MLVQQGMAAHEGQTGSPTRMLTTGDHARSPAPYFRQRCPSAPVPGDNSPSETVPGPRPWGARQRRGLVCRRRPSTRTSLR